MFFSQNKKKYHSFKAITALLTLFFFAAVALLPAQPVFAESLNFTVSYVITEDWGNGAKVGVTIKNNGTSAINGWDLTWTFTGNQQITQLWNGTYTQSGTAVSVKNMSHNATIAGNGGTADFGFTINYSNSNAVPSVFKLNGQSGQTAGSFTQVLPGNDINLAYDVREDWGTGATIDVTVTNKRSTPINGWTVTWTFPGNQTITQLWDGVHTQSGTSVTVKDANYNATIPANGGKVKFGFNINYGSKLYKPTDIKVNGINCMNTATTFQYQGVSFSIPEAASYAGAVITIIPMTQSQLDALTPSAPNVISGSNAGFDVKLDGKNSNTFFKDVEITMGYDISKIPTEVPESAIFIYYYDKASGQWKTMERKSWDAINHTITCTTKYLYPMYTGAMVLSADSSSAEELNTLPKNIEKADPMEGILNLNPPQPNCYGTAEIEYPISLPEGINKLTPKVSLAYSSKSGEGNCGYGWNLDMSAITLETKNGVPKYNGTDKLLLDGNELVSVGDNTYSLKVEGGEFARIKRTGAGFIVEYPDGLKKYYGMEPNSQQSDPVNISHVFGWFLCATVDKFGNQIQYLYSDRTVDSTLNMQSNMTLSKITYGSTYFIDFFWNTSTYSGRINGTRGFLVFNNKKLSSISIKHDESESPLLSYILYYDMGALYKTVLKQIGQRVGTTDFNMTTFDYDTAINGYFSNTNTITSNTMSIEGDEDLRYTFLETDDDKAQSHTEIDFVDINGDGKPDRVAKHRDTPYIYVQYNTGTGFTATKTIPVNDTGFGAAGDKDLRYTYTDDEGKKQHTEIDFTDINGDGLADRVAKHRDTPTFYVQYNTGSGFTETKTIPVNDTDFGAGHKDLRYTFINDDSKKAHSEVDITDMNGDGLPDRVVKQRNDPNFYVQYNTGTGFSATKTIPVNDTGFGAAGDKDMRYTYINDDGKKAHTEIDLVDINGDGLPDRVAKQRDADIIYVQYNTGFGFSATKEIYVDDEGFGAAGDRDLRYTFINDDGKKAHTEIDFVDINGDGLPDRVAKQRDTATIYVQYNNGIGFTTTQQIPVNDTNFVTGERDLRYNFTNDNKKHTEIDFVDFNGDGLPDRVAKHRSDNNFYVQFNTLKDKNLLTKITSPAGSEISLGYIRTNADSNRNATNNYNELTVLNSINAGKPDMVSTNMTISYENGIFDKVEKEFRGFKKVKIVSYDNEKTYMLNISDTTYRVDDKVGAKDPLGIHDLYDPYLKGKIDTAVQKLGLYHNGHITEYILSKEKNIFETANTISPYYPVIYTYLKQKRSWAYRDSMTDNRFVGVDEVNGDLAEENNYTFENGLIVTSQKTEYNDPYDTKDNIITKTTNYISNYNWICQPQNTEKIAQESSQRISLSTLFYNPNGSVYQQNDWDSSTNHDVTTATYQYDYFGNVIQKKDQDGSTTEKSVQYLDGLDYDIEETITYTEKGLTEINRYDAYGRLIEKVNSHNETSRISYDIYGRVTEKKDTIDGNLVTTTKLSYGTSSLNGQTYYVVQADYLNNIESNDFISVQYFKDILGHEVQIKTEAVDNGSKCWVVSGRTDYDKNGRKVKTGAAFTTSYVENDKSIVPFQMLEPSISYTYDDFGRNIKTIMPYGLTVEKRYDLFIENTSTGKRILSLVASSSKDLNGAVLQEYREYQDMLSRKVKIQRLKSDGHYLTTDFSFDLYGNSTVTEGDIGKIEEKKDSLGRISWTRSPDAGKKAYTYNDKGQLVTITEEGRNEADSDRFVNQLQYDSTTNQLSKVKYSYASDDISMTYYPNDDSNIYARSNIKSIIDEYGNSTSYNYGQFWKEEIKVIDAVSYTTKYEYDIQGRIGKVTYPDGEVVTYSYNDGGQLKSVIGNQVYISDIRYDRFGRKTYMKYGNGSDMTYSYDAKNQGLDVYKVNDKNGQKLLNFDYNLDKLGNVTSIADNVVSGSGGTVAQTYQYDGFLNRLTGSTGQYNSTSKTSSYTGSFVYDDNDRMLSKTVNNTTFSYVYSNGNHAPSSMTERTNNLVSTTTFKYDDFGGMTEKTIIEDNGEANTDIFEYDAKHRLTKQKTDDMEQFFMYDHNGQRVRKAVMDSIGYVGQVIYVNGLYSVSTGKVNKNISSGKDIIATKQGNTADGIVYYHSNNIGSTVLTTGADGLKRQSFLYYPYGETWVTDSSSSTGSRVATRLYTGHTLDTESGLYYCNGRYYDPSIGIFITPDPMMDGINHYSYCGNNPVKFTDPSGYIFGIDDLLICLAVIGTVAIVGWLVGTVFGWRDDNIVEGVGRNFIHSLSVIANTVVDIIAYVPFSVMDFLSRLYNAENAGDVCKALVRHELEIFAFTSGGYAFIDVVGAFVALCLVNFGGGVTEWEDRFVLKVKTDGGTPFCIGNKVMGDKDRLGNSGTYDHETGHYYQARMFGVGYVLVMITSPFQSHNTQEAPFEKNADLLGRESRDKLWWT